MRTDDILMSIGLGQYADVFRANDIDDDLLAELTDDDLKSMGIMSLGHRRSILKAIVSFGQGPDWLCMLPSLIALPAKGFFSEPNPVMRLWAACDLVELLLRFSVMVGVAQHTRKSPLSDGIVSRLRPNIEEPTLGKWKLMALVMTDEPAPDPVCVPELKELVRLICSLLDSPDDSRLPETSFSILRNQLAHGGGITRRAASQLLSHWTGRIDGLLSWLKWMQEISIVVRPKVDMWGLLRGPTATPEAWAPTKSIQEELSRIFIVGNEVALLRGSEVLQLWPLCLFGSPSATESSDDVPLQSTQLVYVRRNEVTLQFTPIGSEDAGHALGDERAFEAFLNRFRLNEPTDLSVGTFLVRGFEEEFVRDSSRLVGRECEVLAIASSVGDDANRVCWVTGPAGIGKSFALAKYVEGRLESLRPDEMLLAYRFRSGDDRCARDSFLQFLFERLLMKCGKDAQTLLHAEQSRRRPIDNVREAIARVSDDIRVIVIVLDGLDEIAELDVSFAEHVVFGITEQRVRWLCAGRSERGMAEVFSPERCHHIFPDGVPPMEVADIRAMLLEKIGPLRKKLIRNDVEVDNRVVNPFIEKVAHAAAGLPIYVRYVIGDILSGKLRTLDAGEQLPPSLSRYHEDMLQRCSVGTLHQVLTPIVSTLAVACEALSAAQLGDLLLAGNLVTEEDIAEGIVRVALGSVGAMVKRAPSPDAGEAYTLFHHSLRQHMETSKLTKGVLKTALRLLCRLVSDESAYQLAFGKYLYRCGITHLVNDNRASEAVALLTSFEYLRCRLESLPVRQGVTGINGDWRRIVAKFDFIDEKSIEIERFFRTREYLLLCGDERWPSHRILFQLAKFHAKTGAVADAAESWISANSVVWPSFDLSECDIPVRPPQDGCLGVMCGHSDTVNALAFAADDQIAISVSGNRFDDFTVRIWDVKSHECLRVLRGHSAPIVAVAASADGHVVASGSEDSSVRLWDGVSGVSLGCPLAHEAPVRAVAVSSDGTRVLTGGDDGALREWALPVASIVRTNTVDSGISAVVVDERWTMAVVGCADGTVRILSLANGDWLGVLPAHREGVLSIALAAGAERLVSAGDDGDVSVWDLGTQTCTARWSMLPDDASSVGITPDGKRVLTGCCGGMAEDVFDRSVSVWCADRGERILRLTGHCDFIVALAVNANGTKALSGGGDYGIRVWDLTVPAEELVAPGELIWVGSLQYTADGRSLISASDDATVRVWNSDDRHLRLTMRTSEHDTLRQAVLSPDQQTIVSASEDTFIRHWHATSGQLLRVLSGHVEGINSVCLSPDGRIAYSGDGARGQTLCSVRCWDLVTGISLWCREGAWKEIGQCAVSPDGTCLCAVDWTGSLHVFSTVDGSERAMVETKLQDARSVTFSPDGRTLACSDSAGRVQLRDFRTLEQIGEFVGHTSDVRRMCFSPDGMFLFTVSDDQSIRVWSVSDGAQIAVAFFDSWVVSLALTCRGRVISIGFSDGRMATLTLNNVRPPGPGIVTPTRLFRFGPPIEGRLYQSGELFPGAFDSDLTIRCPACGVTAVIEESWHPNSLSNAKAPCADALLGLPDSAWEYPYCLRQCSTCNCEMRVNPFRADTLHFRRYCGDNSLDANKEELFPTEV